MGAASLAEAVLSVLHVDPRSLCYFLPFIRLLLSADAVHVLLVGLFFHAEPASPPVDCKGWKHFTSSRESAASAVQLSLLDGVAS